MKKYSIRELKGRMANFADEGNTFEEKVNIINQNLFAGIMTEEFSKMSPEQFIKFVRGGLYFPEAKGQYKAVCRYLADVLSYVAGLSDRKPSSLRVYSASKELAKTHIDLEQVVKKGLEDFYRRVFDAMYEEDPNDFIDFLNDEFAVWEWVGDENRRLQTSVGLTGEAKEYGEQLSFREAGIPDEKYLQGNADALVVFEEDKDVPVGDFLDGAFARFVSEKIQGVVEPLIAEYKTKSRKDNSPSLWALCDDIINDHNGLRDKLSSYKKDLNAQTQKGWTLISSAIFSYNYDALNWLIELGADVNARDGAGDTPLHTYVSSVIGNDVDFFKGDDGNKYHTFVDEMLSPLIEAGADINARDRKGNTPLMLLMKGCPHSVVTYILDKFIKAGADVNAKNDAGQTALTIAVDTAKDAERADPDDFEDSDEDINDWDNQLVAVENIKALLEAGADPNVLTDDGDETLLTDLFKSGDDCFTHYPIIVDALIKAGIDVNAKNFFNGTALPLAVNRASIYKKDEEKRTPFVDCIKKLLDAGADPDIEDDNGESAKTIAEGDGDEEISDLLLWSSYTDDEDEENFD